MSRPRDLSARLKTAIGSRSVRQVARDAGLDRQTLRRLLNADRHIDGRGTRGPSTDTVRALAEATGVSPGWLAFGEEG